MRLIVPDDRLPDRRLIKGDAIKTVYWTLNCSVAKPMAQQGLVLGRYGVRADMIGVHHPVTGEYGHMPTPPWIRRIVKDADSYFRGERKSNVIRGGQGLLDFSTWVKHVPAAVPAPQGKNSNNDKDRASNAAYSRRKRAEVRAYTVDRKSEDAT